MFAVGGNFLCVFLILFQFLCFVWFLTLVSLFFSMLGEKKWKKKIEKQFSAFTTFGMLKEEKKANRHDKVTLEKRKQTFAKILMFTKNV